MCDDKIISIYNSEKMKYIKRQVRLQPDTPHYKEILEALCCFDREAHIAKIKLMQAFSGVIEVGSWSNLAASITFCRHFDWLRDNWSEISNFMNENLPIMVTPGHAQTLLQFLQSQQVK